MAKFWFKRINGDIERLGEVPELWRSAVEVLIVINTDESGSV